MTDNAVLDKAVNKTIRYLGQIINKPALTVEHLQRPKFRYLFGIVVNVMTTTHFMEGLYTAEELSDPRSFNREQKVAFLTKAIECVGIAANTHIAAQANKIVAGLEPELTNVWLQQLAKASVSETVDRAACVAKVLAGETMPPPGAGKAKKAKQQPAAPVEAAPVEAAPAEAAPSEDAAAAAAAAEKEKERAERRKRKEAERRRREEEAAAEAERAAAEKAAAKEARRKAKEAAAGRSLAASESAASKFSKVSETAESLGKQASAASVITTTSEAGQSAGPAASTPAPGDGDDIMARMKASQGRARRPQTAGRAPPRRKANAEAVPSATAAVIEAPAAVRAGVIVEGGSGNDDDSDGGDEDEDAGVGTAGDGDAAARLGGGPGEDHSNMPDDGQQGKLVTALKKQNQRIAEHKDGKAGSGQGKSGAGAASAADGAAEGIILGGSRNKKQQDRKDVAAEIAALQHAIQSLCRAANPLGRAMDYVQEDLENMAKEMAHWTSEVRVQTDAYAQARAVSENELQPLRDQLAQMDAKLASQRDSIVEVKSKVHANDATIQQMLQLVTSNGGA